MLELPIRKIIYHLRARVLPTEHQRELARWWADDPDDQRRFRYDLDEHSVVFDLGGYQGQWASDLFARYRCRVLVFEPVRAFAERIRARFERNPRIEVFSFGLGASTRSERLRVAADGSSIFARNGREERIEIVDASEWIERNLEPPRRIHLMKINIEGGEFELLERLVDTRLVESIDDILVQFHRVAPDSAVRMERIQRALRRTHEPTYQYRFVWENWRRSSVERP